MGPTQTPSHTPIVLVNPTDLDLYEVRIETGGYVSDDTLGVLKSDAPPKELGGLKARNYIQIEDADDEELFEFVIWWHVSYVVGGTRAALRFSLFKGTGGIDVPNVPVLGAPGVAIERYE